MANRVLAGWQNLLDRHRWAVFVLPLAVFLLIGAMEPSPERPGGSALGLSIDYASYPVVYTLKLALTSLAVLAVAPGYRRLPLQLSWWSLLVGVAGAALWIGLCSLRLEEQLLSRCGLSAGLSQRSAFNPLEELADRPVWAYGFLLIRLIGLAAVVPVIEEFFLRGFAMRMAIASEWWNVPFGRLTPLAALAGTVLPVLMHPPTETLAVIAWFSLVTWLMVRTRSIGDCIVAHAATNLLLGAYVVASGDWRLL